MPGAYIRSHPVHDPVFYRQWALAHDHCQACGVPATLADWPGLSTHHLIKPGRSDERCNLSRLCHCCHNLAELLDVRCPIEGTLLPKLPIGVCLQVKKLREPSDYDPDRLAVLFGRPLPDLLPIPLRFVQLYCTYQHPFRCRCVEDLVSQGVAA